MDIITISLFFAAASLSAVYSDYVTNVAIKSLTVILMFMACSMYFSLNELVTAESMLLVLRKLAYIITALNLVYWVTGRAMYKEVFRGFFANRNACGATLVIISIVLLGSYVKYKKLLDLGAFIINIVLIFATSSKGTFMGICVGVVVFMYLTTQKKLNYIGKVIGIVILIVLFWDKIQTIPTIERIMTEGLKRDVLWAYAMEQIRQHPILGVGFSSSGLSNSFGEYSGMNYHNSYIAMLADVGIVGVIFFAIMFIRLGFGVFTNYYKLHLSRHIEIATLIAICIAFFALSFGEAYLIVAGSPFSFIFWCCVFCLYYGRVECI